MKKFNSFSGKMLSLVLAVALLLTAVVIPTTVTASAVDASAERQPNSANYFSTEFSADDALPLSNDVLTDQDGKSFYNVRYSQSSGENDGYVTGDLVTLTDGDGVEHTLMDVKCVKVTSGPNAFMIVPVDENGHPFKLENNAAYSIDYKFYVKKCPNGTQRLEFGRGAVRGHYSKQVDYKTEPANYGMVGLLNSFVTTNSYPVNAATGASTSLHEHKIVWQLDNAFPITLGGEPGYTNENWYDKSFSGTKTLITNEYEHGEDGYIAMPDTSYDGWGYYFDDYFTISGDFGSAALDNNPPEILFDYITVTKLADVPFDAGVGTVNGNSTGKLQDFPGVALPTPLPPSGKIFAGWYSTSDFQEGTEVTTYEYGMSTVYAKYEDGVFIDYDNYGSLDWDRHFYADSFEIHDGPLPAVRNHYGTYSVPVKNYKDSYYAGPDGIVNQKLHIVDGNGNSGARVMEDGNKNLYTLTSGNKYIVSYDVLFTGTPYTTGYARIGTGLKFGSSDGSSTGKITGAKYTLANTGAIATDTSGTYTYYQNGVAKTAQFGTWSKVIDTFVADITDTTDPFASVLSLDVKGNKYDIYIDNITIQEIAKVEVNFDAGDGTVNGESIGTFKVLPGAALPNPVAPEGKKFKGWYTTSDFQDGTLIKVFETGLTNVYAKYETVREGYFSTEFSVDDALPLSNDVLTDQKGKNFYNVRYAQSLSTNDGVVTGDLVTLTDGDGVEHTLMDVKFVQVNSGPMYAIIVPVDENGNPFKLENNATYSIDYRFYVKKSYTWKRVEFGRGAARGYHSGAVALADFALNYATTNLANKCWVSTTCYPIDAVEGSSPTLNKHLAYLPLDNAFPITVSGGSSYDNANWYDKKFEGTTTLVTNEYEHDENGLIYQRDPDFSTWGYIYDDYFTIATEMGYDKMADNPPEILFDYITITKLVDVPFDAGVGTVNGESTGKLKALPGAALPTPVAPLGKIFAGWYSTSDFQEGTEVTEVVDGLTAVYAKYEDGIFIDYDTPGHGDLDWDLYINPETLELYITDDISGDPYAMYSFPIKHDSKELSYFAGPDGVVDYKLTINDPDNHNGGARAFDNDGKLLIAEKGKTYKVTYDVYVTGSDTKDYDTFAKLGAGLQFGETKDGNPNGRIAGMKRKFNNTGIYVEAGASDYTYYQYGVPYTAEFGKWITVTDVISIDFDDEDPFAYAYGFAVKGGTNTIRIDNIKIVETDTLVKLDAGQFGSAYAVFGKEGDVVTLLDAVPNTDKATFNGWKDADGQLVDAEYTVPAEPVTLYADWAIETAAIKFYEEDGTLISELTGEFGAAVVAPAATAPEGKDCFVGWLENGELVDITTVTFGLEEREFTALFTTYGDANGDGEFDARDLVRVAKAVAGQTVELDEKAGDVNADGIVDNLDLIRLKKFFAGVAGVVLGTPDAE